jgi:hypothetical protein
MLVPEALAEDDQPVAQGQGLGKAGHLEGLEGQGIAVAPGGTYVMIEMIR